MWIAHPSRDKPLLGALGHKPMMNNVVNLFLSADDSSLAMQRVVGVVDDDRVHMMMGSMLITPSARPKWCSNTWPDTRTALPSPTAA